MKSYAIEHVGLAADDPESLAAWYVASLGFREFFRTASAPPVIFLEAPAAGAAGTAAEPGTSGGPGAGTKLEIFPRKAGDPKPGFDQRAASHLAILVGDFEEAVADLEARGVVFIGDTKEIFAGGKARFFADPEGNRLHIVHRPLQPW
jgi:catechol 2,3-dioxygenase-like lactoylglutathione lyase family enzyme